jgi:biotin operon repressor
MATSPPPGTPSYAQASEFGNGDAFPRLQKAGQVDLAASRPTWLISRRQRSWPGWQADRLADAAANMRKDVREFIRRLEAEGLTVESTPGHYRVLRDGEPLRKANGMPFTLPFSPDTVRWRRAAIVELRKLGIEL